MIVCSCKVISDKDVKAACCGGEAPQTVSQLYHRLGYVPDCGRCAPTIRSIMREDRTAG